MTSNGKFSNVNKMNFRQEYVMLRHKEGRFEREASIKFSQNTSALSCKAKNVMAIGRGVSGAKNRFAVGWKVARLDEVN